WFCVLAVMAYTAFVIWTDARRNLEVFKAFSWSALPLIIGLVIVNFLLREVKWDFFRRKAGINVPRFGSFLVFFSDYSMAISPGRVGELIKPFMYKEYFGKSMRRSIPLVFCERLTDLLGMIVLAGITLAYYVGAVAEARSGGGASTRIIYGFLALSVITVIALIALMRNKRLVYGILHWITRYRLLRGSSGKLRK